MQRGGTNGVREVHVDGVEKQLEPVKNGIQSPMATNHGVVPVPGEAGWVITPANSGDGKAVRDINEIAADFIRRSKKKFQGSGATTKYGQKVIT
nr:unnamed protein product [Digitaria exilis]